MRREATPPRMLNLTRSMRRMDATQLPSIGMRQSVERVWMRMVCLLDDADQPMTNVIEYAVSQSCRLRMIEVVDSTSLRMRMRMRMVDE